MKFKKIVLVTLLLLAILTIGTVSATQDMDLNDTLAVDETGDVVEVSPDNDFLCNGDLNDTRDVLSESQEDIVDIGIYDADDFEITYPSYVYHVDSKDILNLIVPNDLDEGMLELTITNDDGDSKAYSLDFPDEGDDEIISVLGDFDLIDSAGKYELSLKYISQYQELEIDTWTLDVTAALEYIFFSDGKFDYITLDYPGDFMIIYKYVLVDLFEIYVGQNPDPFEFDGGKERYNLEDLGIDSVGIYSIFVKNVLYNDSILIQSMSKDLLLNCWATLKFHDPSDSLKFDNTTAGGGTVINGAEQTEKIVQSSSTSSSSSTDADSSNWGYDWNSAVQAVLVVQTMLVVQLV